MPAKLVPELYCSDIGVSRTFYCDVLGFDVVYERPQEGFLYLHFQGSELMLEALIERQRRWLTDHLRKPFGRGINFQWEVADVQGLYQKVSKDSASSIYLPLESKSYQCGEVLVTVRQFIVQDPDGYLFRFCQDV